MVFWFAERNEKVHEKTKQIKCQRMNGQNPAQSVLRGAESRDTGSKAGNALNVDRCQCGPYNKKRGTLRQAAGLINSV
jgi:hypothetical protein